MPTSIWKAACSDGSVSTGYDTDSIAAAVGGTTTILDYVIQEHGDSLQETVTNWSERAKQSAIDYGFHLIITQPNDKTFDELSLLVEQQRFLDSIPGREPLLQEVMPILCFLIQKPNKLLARRVNIKNQIILLMNRLS